MNWQAYTLVVIGVVIGGLGGLGLIWLWIKALVKEWTSDMEKECTVLSLNILIITTIIWLAATAQWG